MTCSQNYPLEENKRRICLSFVSFVIIIVSVLVLFVVQSVIDVQAKFINKFLTDIAFSNFQSISDATSQLKKNDLQELFRESAILDAFFSIPLQDTKYISSNYLANSKINNLISSSTCNDICTNDTKLDKMVYYLFPQLMDYTKLANYSPADTQIDL